ncbi:hypothetical protein B0H14DRAFT_2571177 [Mycena olivaceomarginata]|nr:hypothetical protein B0H14DRAFT_2571177 [Mycena olivaceomarginata]
MKSIPWAEIVSTPAQHYDTSGNFFSITLAHPQNLSVVEVVALAESLLSTSVIDSPTPFRFLEAEGTTLVPPTPSTPLLPLLPVIQAPPPAGEIAPPPLPPPPPKLLEAPQDSGAKADKFAGIGSRDMENPTDGDERPATGIIISTVFAQTNRSHPSIDQNIHRAVFEGWPLALRGIEGFGVIKPWK